MGSPVANAAITLWATGLLLAALRAQADDPNPAYPWCQSPTSTAAPTISPSPTSVTTKSATGTQLFQSASRLDEWTTRVSGGQDSVLPSGVANQLRGLPVPQRRQLDQDVKSSLGLSDNFAVADLSPEQMQQSSEIVAERQWLNTYSARVDPRVVEGTLGKPADQLTSGDLISKKREITSLASTYFDTQHPDVIKRWSRFPRQFSRSG